MKTLKTTILALTIILTTLLASCSKESVNPTKTNTKVADTTWRIKSMTLYSDSIKAITYDANGFITSIKHVVSFNSNTWLDTFTLLKTKSGSDSIACSNGLNGFTYIKMDKDSTDMTIGGFPLLSSQLYTNVYFRNGLVNSIATSTSDTFNYYYATNGTLDSATFSNPSLTPTRGIVTTSSKTTANPLHTIPFQVWNVLYEWEYFDESTLYAVSAPNEIDAFHLYYSNADIGGFSETFKYTFDVHGNLTTLNLGNSSSGGGSTPINFVWEVASITQK